MHEHAHRLFERALRIARTIWGGRHEAPEPKSESQSQTIPNATPELSLSVPQGRAGLSHQHEGRVASNGNCGGDVYGTADQQARDCDRSGAGGERGREQECAARGHRGDDRVGRRHAHQVALAHEGRERVARASELDAQDGRRGGQKRNARVHRPERTVQQQVERHAHRVRRDARHGHLPLAAQRGQDAHRHKAADARYEAHRDDGSHCTLSSFTAI